MPELRTRSSESTDRGHELVLGLVSMLTGLSRLGLGAWELGQTQARNPTLSQLMNQLIHKLSHWTSQHFLQ